MCPEQQFGKTFSGKKNWVCLWCVENLSIFPGVLSKLHFTRRKYHLRTFPCKVSFLLVFGVWAKSVQTWGDCFGQDRQNRTLHFQLKFLGRRISRTIYLICRSLGHRSTLFQDLAKLNPAGLSKPHSTCQSELFEKKKFSRKRKFFDLFGFWAIAFWTFGNESTAMLSKPQFAC